MTKLLFVDDEPTIRSTLPRILELHEFDVKAVASVREALAAIQAEHFDVLLSDLNIGQPSDGFTVVSAMRRIQPDALTVIITGFPAFETALQAIRDQVDDYIVKPTRPDDLVAAIRQKLANRERPTRPPLKRVYELLEDNLELIMSRYVEALSANDDFPIKGLSSSEIKNSLPEVLREVIRDLHQRAQEQTPGVTEAAQEHGRSRCRQNFELLQLVEEIRILRNIVYDVLQQNLLTVEVSSLIPDMIRISDSLDARLRESIGAFVSERRPDVERKMA